MTVIASYPQRMARLFLSEDGVFCLVYTGQDVEIFHSLIGNSFYHLYIGIRIKTIRIGHSYSLIL